MWQRFTERARKVVFYAQEEAQRFGEGYVSTEHLLLGLVREPDSSACRVLVRAGLSLEKIRIAVESQLPKGEDIPSQDMTLTPRAKRVIDLAYEEARRLNNNHIGSEHLLLGLIREGDGLAARVLRTLGAELEAIRELVVAEVAPSGESVSSSQAALTRRVQSSANAWLILSLRRGRLIADLQCLIFLNEDVGDAFAAVLACGVNPKSVVTVIEEIMLETKGPSELSEETLWASALLALAEIEAEKLGQKINGAHFLLAALAEGSTITARVLETFGVGYEVLRTHLDDKS